MFIRNQSNTTMNKDPYRRVAGIYDRVFESMNKGLTVLGVRMYLPPKEGSVLDVGCGTGMHLETYKRFKCKLYGVDTSPSMLQQARNRLGESAELIQADATELPFEKDTFDLILCMLVLHEMDDEVRTRVLNEMNRVLKPDGRILLIDYHTGKPVPVKGWYPKLVIVLTEIAAGRRHYKNYRHFKSIGGLPALIERSHFKTEKEKIIGDDTIVMHLLQKK
jgi:ubiquinone/menaquinone biosynthesis C-methylase UbiE